MMPVVVAEYLSPVVLRCLPDRPGDDIVQTGDMVQACLAPNSGVVVAVPGAIPVLLIQAYPSQGFPQLFTAWREDDKWRLQEPRDDYAFGDYRLVEPGRRSYGFGSSDPSVYTNRPAREETIGARTLLAALFTDSAYGDQTIMRLVLFAFEQGMWRVRWNSRADPSGQLSHLSLEFTGDGIDGVALTATSWFLKDEKSHIFGEVNAGPHRIVHETLQLEGDQYVVTEAHVSPSPYNSLVEFVYALRHGDPAAAEARTTGPAVVDQLSALGFGASFPGGQAMEEERCCGPIIISTGVPKRIRVYFAERNGEWYISAAEALDRLPWEH